MIGHSARALRKNVRWLMLDFPRSPRLEIYARQQHRSTLQLTHFMRNGGAEAHQSYTAPYRDRAIPRTIWIYWAQGEEHAPPLVRRCIASWRHHHPSWSIQVLDQQTAAKYTSSSDFWDGQPKRIYANLLRLRLLAQHGGVWVDATLLCHRPLDEWLPLLGGQTGFFTFRGPHSDRWIDNWFIAANPANPLITAWLDTYAAYIGNRKKVPPAYFMMIYCLQWAIQKNPALMDEFRRSGGLPAVPCFFLHTCIEGKGDLADLKRAVADGLPLSKLNWKSAPDGTDIDDMLTRVGL